MWFQDVISSFGRGYTAATQIDKTCILSWVMMFDLVTVCYTLTSLVDVQFNMAV